MIKNMTLLAVVLVLTLAAMELFLRIVRPAGAELLPAFVVDEQTGWSRAANQHGFVIQRVPGIFKTHFQTNSRGLRDREYALEKSGKLRILALGDSMTEGWGVEENESYPKVLEAQYLRDVEVWNLGVVGYSTDQELQQLQRVIDAYRPDVVTLAFSFNDLAENSFSRALWAPNYVKPHFEVRGDRIVLTNAPALRQQRLDADRKARGLRARVQDGANRLAVYRFTKYAAKIAPEYVHKTPKVKRPPVATQHSLWYSIDKLYRTVQNEDLNNAWALSERLVVEINRLCQSRDVSFVLTYVPAPYDGVPDIMQTQLKLMGLDEPLTHFDMAMIEKRLAQGAQRNRIRFISMGERFRGAGDPPGLFLPQMLREVHIGSRGHQLVARVMAEYLQSEGLIPVQHVRTDRLEKTSPSALAAQ